MEFLTWQIVMSAVGGVLALAVAIARLTHFGAWRWIARCFRMVTGMNRRQALSQLADSVSSLELMAERQSVVMENVLKELHPNGGTSMRDAVDSMNDRLHRSDAILKTYILTRSEGLFETDVKGRLTEANRAYLRFTGRTMDEVRGWGWKNVVHSEDVAEVATEWTRCVREERDFSMRCRFTQPDGDIVPVHISAHRISTAGDVIGWLGVVTRINRSPE